MWSWMRATNKLQKSSGVGNLITYHAVGQPVWTPRRYDALAHEGLST